MPPLSIDTLPIKMAVEVSSHFDHIIESSTAKPKK